VQSKYGKIRQKFDLMTTLDNALAKGDGQLVKKAEKSMEKLFFKTVEVDMLESQTE
jgi:hypothetical protein